MRKIQIFVDADAYPVVDIGSAPPEWQRRHEKAYKEDDVRFAQSFEKLILMAKSKEGAQSGTI